MRSLKSNDLTLGALLVSLAMVLLAIVDQVLRPQRWSHFRPSTWEVY